MGTAKVQHVFLNCPFDTHYKSLFEAIVFAVSDCGFTPRCALEIDDGSQIRIEKIFKIISECRFGIHDISKTELDETNNLPRFNMPLELGMFLGAKRYGSKEHTQKICLILDREEYRYQKFLSDIAGQDIRAHRDDPKTTIVVVRNWLRNASPSISMLGGEAICSRYNVFRKELPSLCQDLRLSPQELTFIDYTWLVTGWLRQNP
ncbi:MAG: hypothetical protein QOF89_5996 [Acidobacteriota bacterium]|jgi:hypothetical protein|nr:hypothetical protein [Acidobacteriota bacterium]